MPQVRFNPWPHYRQQECRWWSWRVIKANGERGKERHRWVCHHERVCATCGKIFDRDLGERCPDYRERS